MLIFGNKVSSFLFIILHCLHRRLQLNFAKSAMIRRQDNQLSRRFQADNPCDSTKHQRFVH